MAIYLLINHLWLADLQLVTLATHCLDEHRDVEHATSLHYPAVGISLDSLHAQGDILLKLLHQAVVDLARGAKLALATEERRVVDSEEHRHSRLVDGDRRQWLRILKVGYCVTNLKVLKADDGANVTTVNRVHALVGNALESVKFLDLGLLL